MATAPPDTPRQTARQEAAHEAPAPFGANEMRLSGRQWLAVAAIVLVFAALAPRLWRRAERFSAGPDYRVPYALSTDYWLYQRRADELAGAAVIPVLGDSVVWGEYVRPEGTLTHFLNDRSRGRPPFANLGLNGVFPLAMEGLVVHYGGSLQRRKVVVHCNLLWMSSPKADLSTAEEETFNHPALVPQAVGRVPCYRADTATRLGYVAARSMGLCAWVQHVDDAYFDQMSIPAWTLAQDDRDSPGSPNAWRSPLGRTTMVVPGEPVRDPQRGPTSTRHRPWNARGARPTEFEWVPLVSSLQWQAFQRLVVRLRARGDDVLVVVGPFNEHIVVAEQLPTYRRMRDEVAAWLDRQRVPRIVPEALPSELYADASHPLTAGYDLLAGRIWADPMFQAWARHPAPRR